MNTRNSRVPTNLNKLVTSKLVVAAIILYLLKRLIWGHPYKIVSSSLITPITYDYDFGVALSILVSLALSLYILCLCVPKRVGTVIIYLHAIEFDPRPTQLT